MTKQQPWPWPEAMDALAAAPSVMIIDEPARIRYYQDGALQFESPARRESPPGVQVHWLEPEGPHSVENIDEHRYHAIRIELR